MRHPIESCNVEQAAVLASLPEESRKWMARLFRIGNATYCYYNQVKDYWRKPVAAEWHITISCNR